MTVTCSCIAGLPQNTKTDAIGFQIGVYPDWCLCICRSRRFRLGWAQAFFLSSTTNSVCGATICAFDSIVFRRRKCENRCARRPRQSLGHVVFVIIGFLNPYLPAYTDRKELWTIDGDTIRWLGVALFAAGGALRIWPVFVLGHRFSGLVVIQPGHTLVTNGVYRVIRPPPVTLAYLSIPWDGAWLSVRQPAYFSHYRLSHLC